MNKGLPLWLSRIALCAVLLLTGLPLTVTATPAAPQADLSLSNWAHPNPAPVGDPVVFRLVIANLGPHPASGVTISSMLPAGLAYRGYTTSHGTCQVDGQAFTCAFDALLTAETAYVNISMDVPLDAQGAVSYTATVAANESDPVLANNTATATMTFRPNVDLALTQHVTPEPAVTGGVLTYQLVVTNRGKSPATSVVLTDTLPADVSVQQIAPTQGTCQRSETSITCNLDTLAPAHAVTTTITTRVAVDATLLRNTATVAAAESDLNPADNSVARETTVISGTDLVVQAWAIPAPVVTSTLLLDPLIAGLTPVGYLVHARNAGPFDATNARLSLTLPPSLTLEDFTTGGCTSFSAADSVYQCAIGDMPVGMTATLHFTMSVIPSGFVDNASSADLVAMVSLVAEEEDGNPADNKVEVVTPVYARAALSLTLTAPDNVTPGELLAYHHVITNAGPSDAAPLVLTDTFPAGVVFESGDGATCAGADPETIYLPYGGVRCTAPRLLPGATLTITVYARTDATVRGTFVTTATVASPAEDWYPDDNTATVTTTVRVFIYLPLTLRSYRP